MRLFNDPSSPPPTVRSEGTAWTAAAVSPSEAAAALRESASIMRCGGGQESAQRGPAALTGQQTAGRFFHGSLFEGGSLLL